MVWGKIDDMSLHERDLFEMLLRANDLFVAVQWQQPSAEWLAAVARWRNAYAGRCAVKSVKEKLPEPKPKRGLFADDGVGYDPGVVIISEMLGISTHVTITALHSLHAWVSGCRHDVMMFADIDRKVGIHGFGKAVEKLGWIRMNRWSEVIVECIPKGE